MIKKIMVILLGALCAIVTFFTFDPGAMDRMRFSAGLYDTTGQEQEIKKAIADFNLLYASFFSTGGNLDGLWRMPASNLVKRRIVQDIGNWSSNGRVLAYDKLGVSLLRLEFFSLTRAVAETSEQWVLLLREIGKEHIKKKTRDIDITVKYIFVLTDRGWFIEDFEVHPAQKVLPDGKGRV